MTAETAARVAVRRPSALDSAAPAAVPAGGVVGEPGAQRGPAAAPVVAAVRRGRGTGGRRPAAARREHGVRVLRPGGGFRLGHRRGQPGQVAVKLGHEVGHVGEQGVLVPQERVRRGVGRPDDLAEGQVELGRAAGHVVEDRVQPGQPPVDLLRVLRLVAAASALRSSRMSEKTSRDRFASRIRAAEHVLHGGERAVAELAELVDRLPVPVPGQASRPRGVLEPVHHPSSASASSCSRRLPVQPGYLVVDGAPARPGRPPRHRCAPGPGARARSRSSARSTHR